jgi:hypothetical protein
MACERYIGAIQELADGTLGSIRRAELELHMESCAGCRRLADDLLHIRELAGSLERPAPPDRVWLQIAGRLRQEGRVAAPAAMAGARPYYPLALAASLLLVVAASLYFVYPRGPADQPPAAVSNPAPAGTVEADAAIGGVAEELNLVGQHLQNAITKLEQATTADGSAVDPQMAALLQKNLQVIDQAIAESTAALRSEPQSAPARDSLVDALRRKVLLLQDTIALMNQMRRGDAAGAAQVVEGANKS